MTVFILGELIQIVGRWEKVSVLNDLSAQSGLASLVLNLSECKVRTYMKLMVKEACMFSLYNNYCTTTSLKLNQERRTFMGRSTLLLRALTQVAIPANFG